MLRQALAVALYCCVGLTNAATINPQLARSDICGGYEIVHINGVNTSTQGAFGNLERLRVVYGNAHNEQLLRYALAYNRTNWIVADLQQSFAQLIADHPGTTYAEWLEAVINGIWPGSLPAGAIADISGRLGTLLGLNRPNPYADTNLVDMLYAIRAIPSRRCAHGDGGAFTGDDICKPPP